MNSEKRLSLFTFHFSLRWRELAARASSLVRACSSYPTSIIIKVINNFLLKK